MKIINPPQGFPDGIKRNENGAYGCNNCDASYMNTKIAKSHSCEQYNKNQKKNRYIKTLESPIGGFSNQVIFARKKFYG